MTEHSNDNDGELHSVTTDMNQFSDSWIIDSSCMYHMRMTRHLFKTYKSNTGGFILLRNNAEENRSI